MSNQWQEGACGPDPSESHPLAGIDRLCFVKNTCANPQIVIGDYTYYDDPENSEHFERNVLYLFPFIGDRLVLGKFCAIARGVKFVMNGANHQLDGFSTYPFYVFGKGWERAAPDEDKIVCKGDTIVGNDVWLGYEALVLPGVTIGHGAMVAARSVVTADVPPYAIVGGNPAQIIRPRFSEAIAARLLEIAWWDWDIGKITRNLQHIVGADIEALERAQ